MGANCGMARRPGRPRKIRPFKHLYNRAWRRRSRHQLKTHPLCVYCLEEGVHTPATVSDHVIPHKGNVELFRFGELQSLCVDHHNSRKQRLECHGFDSKIGLDGWPVDPNHPANSKCNSFGPRPTYPVARVVPERIDVVSKLLP